MLLRSLHVLQHEEVIQLSSKSVPLERFATLGPTGVKVKKVPEEQPPKHLKIQLPKLLFNFSQYVHLFFDGNIGRECFNVYLLIQYGLEILKLG